VARAYITSAASNCPPNIVNLTRGTAIAVGRAYNFASQNILIHPFQRRFQRISQMQIDAVVTELQRLEHSAITRRTLKIVVKWVNVNRF